MLLRLGKGLNPSRFVVSLFCELVGSIRVLQRLASNASFPASLSTFFIVLSSSPMGLGGKLVVLSSLPVQIMHNTSVQRKLRDRSQKTAGAQQTAAGAELAGKTPRSTS